MHLDQLYIAEHGQRRQLVPQAGKQLLRRFSLARQLHSAEGQHRGIGKERRAQGFGGAGFQVLLLAAEKITAGKQGGVRRFFNFLR